MLKRTTDHTIYEVYCEDAAECVFVDHKPTRKEICQIRDENWPDVAVDEIQVYKEQHFYVRDPNPPKNSKEKKCTYCDGTGKTDKCGYCCGSGWKSDDSYSSFPCPWCEKGRINEKRTCSECGGRGRGTVWGKNPVTGKVQIKKNGKVIGEQG